MTEPRTGLATATVRIMIAGFIVAGPVIALAPRGMASLMIALAFLATAAERIAGRRWPRISTSLFAVLLAFLAYAEISLAWDISRSAGLRKLLDLTTVSASLLALLGLGARMNASQQRRLAMVLVGTTAAALVLLAIETIFHYPLYRAALGDSNPRLNALLESKRSVDALPLLVWPAALALARLRRPWWGVALAAAYGVASIVLTASAALLAMLVSGAAFVLASRSVKALAYGMAATILALFALMAPIAILIYRWGGTTASWLKHSAHHRIEIWHFVSERILERPVLGHGIESSRYIPNGDEVSAFLPPDKPIIPLHPHNLFLQVWLELGLFGVVIVAALMLMPFFAIQGWPRENQRFALATYAAGIVIAALSFGLWQSWWMATMVFAAAACRALGPGSNYT